MGDQAVDARNVAFASQVQANAEAGTPVFLTATGPWIHEAQGQSILLGYEGVYGEQQKAWHVPEREIGFPSDYRFLVLKAYRDGQISTGRAASLLSMDRQEFEDDFTSREGEFSESDFSGS